MTLVKKPPLVSGKPAGRSDSKAELGVWSDLNHSAFPVPNSAFDASAEGKVKVDDN